MGVHNEELRHRRNSLTRTSKTEKVISRLRHPTGVVKRISSSIPIRKIPYPRIQKPPQLIRWDFLILLLCEIWGFINSLKLPLWLRSPIYRAWGYFFKCNMEEVRDPLEEYKCLQEFFGRPMKEGARPIAKEMTAVSPVDGKVLSVGIATNHVEQVKGHSYTLNHFLGSDYRIHPNSDLRSPSPGNKLYQIVLYLAPGDYHRIHSPADWKVLRRRHFPGTLLPVAPVVGKIVPQLLALNERVVLTGEWEHGFYSYTAVGAYNVGSIQLHFDDVRTNNLFRDYRCPNLRYFSWKGLGSHFYEKNYENPIAMNKGEEMGLFRLGSTVVLIFEAPDDFEFTVKPNEKIKMGQPLGNLKSTISPASANLMSKIDEDNELATDSYDFY